MSDTPLEASPEDVDLVAPVASALPWDADPADVAEQRAEVPLDDDEWA